MESETNTCVRTFVRLHLQWPHDQSVARPDHLQYSQQWPFLLSSLALREEAGHAFWLDLWDQDRASGVGFRAPWIEYTSKYSLYYTPELLFPCQEKKSEATQNLRELKTVKRILRREDGETVTLDMQAFSSSLSLHCHDCIAPPPARKYTLVTGLLPWWARLEHSQSLYTTLQKNNRT